MINKYEDFKINFKGLLFEVKLLDDSAEFPNDDSKRLHEEFKVYVSNGTNKINFKHYNSGMERELTKILNNKKEPLFTFTGILNIREFKTLMTKKFMWGGYDKIINLQTLRTARIKNLLYGIINNLACDLENNGTFKDFCDNYGYDFDSRKAKKIYHAVTEQNEKLQSLNLTREQKEYLREEAEQETEQFEEDILKAVQELN